LNSGYLVSPAEPGEHAAHEAVLLRHLAQGVEHLAVDQTEVSNVSRDADRGHAGEHPIEQMGGDALEPAFACARQTARIDDVVALLPFGDHLFDDFRRVLQVGIHDDDRCALRRVHAGGDGDLVAEIARQADIAEARVALGERLQHDGAGIAAPVVDQDRLRRPAKPGEQQVEPAQQHRQHGFLVEDGDDDAVDDRLGIGRHLRGSAPLNGRKSRTPVVKGALPQPLRTARF
jgi:hypothetical protein